MKDYYDILGVSRDAAADDLKRAFRQLAMKYHPDRNPDNKQSEDKFKEINEAYSCLSDPQKRAHYDRFGSSEGMGGGYAGAGFGDIFEDIFGDLFGAFGGTGRQRAAKGSDLRYDLGISLSEAVFGAEKTIDFPKWEICKECKGSGSEPGKSPETCPSCKGAGQIRFQQGFFSVSKSCSKCQGTGHRITHPCKKCKGTGRIKENKSISLKIPAGVDTGSRLRVSGEGELGEYGGPSGDLYVVLNVEEHPFFKREGTEIFCEAPVSFPQAALGAEIEIPTIDGAAKLKIPPGAQSGRLFTIKGKGAPRVGGHQRGNQIVRIYVEVPTKLTPRQRELLEEFTSINGGEAAKGFKEKLKDLFSGVEN
ncbi:MAG: molecular chaperone DnaJ [Nitrospira bacterium HGW-Nitrospira-1]|nr:MAG: molecular chaperone DnaJ [Nitrospira bacterium HGW-Nitrospira-1]